MQITNETAITEHPWNDKHSYNDSFHWYDCVYCDATKEYAEHTTDDSGYCTVCDNPVGATEGIIYDISADGTYAEVVGYSGTAKRIVIADTYGGLPVTGIYNEAFKRTSITSVVIPDSVTSIGDNAFYYCSKLTSVEIGDSVTEIGNYAFQSCYSLTSVYITDIAAWCNIDFNSSYASPLYYAKNLYLDGELITELVIPDSVTKIGNYAFDGCTSLTSVVIPDSVTKIGTYAFCGCSKLTSVTINGTPNIGQFAFSSCNNALYTEYEFCKYVCNAENPYAVLVEVTTNNLSTYVIHDSTQAIGSGAFKDCSRLTSITIPKSITSIGECAFYDCTALEEVCFNASEMNDLNFSNRVFYNAGKNGDGIKVVIGANVTKIPAYLFYPYDSSSYAPKITSVEFAEGSICESIGDSAFYGCTVLTSVHITDIEAWCNINFTNSSANPLTYAKKLYLNGKLITELVIPDGVTAIPTYAFYYLSSITSVVIPDSVTTIGDSAFDGCTSLTSVNITDIAAWCNINFADYYANPICYAKKLYLNGKLITELVIPDGVTAIPMYAFYYQSSITSVVIPDSVTSIGDRAFYGCSSLTSVHITDIAAWCNINFTNSSANPLLHAKKLYLNGKLITELVIPDGVTAIPMYAFYYQSSITSVVIPDSVTTIGDYAFYGCESLMSVVIPDSVTTIGSDAFSGCSVLTSVVIPDSVTKIGSYAFSECTSLTSVNITDIAAWCNINFGNYSANPLYYAKNLYLNGELITELVIPDSVTEIGSSAFSGCSSLTSVEIGDSVTKIGNYAFYDCNSLTSVEIGDSVTKIGNYAFYYCRSLTSVVIGDSVTSIGDDAFSGCTNLTSVVIGDSVTEIGDSAFSGCSGLKSVVIGDSVTEIGYWAFYDCDRLTSVVIGDSVTTIGSNAFYNCDRLTSVVIPDSVTTIGEYAFYRCYNLTSIKYRGTQGEWNAITKLDHWNWYTGNYTTTYNYDGE